MVEPDFGRVHGELRRKGVLLTLLRQQHCAGERLFVDYAGPTLEPADGGRGQVFVAAMGASRYTFACVTAEQSMRSWLGTLGRYCV